MLDIPGLEDELRQEQEFDWGFYRKNFLSREETAALLKLASSWPRKREQSAYGNAKIPMWTCKAAGHPKKLRGFVSAESQPTCPTCGSAEVKPVLKRIIGLGSFSISPNKRGLKDGVVNPKAQTIEDAPPEIKSLADKLTQLNDGKPVNYLSFIAYENEQDHIDWHQHNEDRCRDATVYIVSMGEIRTFGVRPVCGKHQFCAACCDRCHQSGKSLCVECKKKNKARKKCKVCGDTTKWVKLQPAPGSVIKLTDEANRTHEHAVLGKQDVGGDKTARGLRISVNTKNIREEDALYVERENRAPTPFAPPIPLTAETIHKGIAPGVNKPRVYSIKRKHPQDAIYVGCACVKKGCKCHATDIKGGSMYGNSYKPREFWGHSKCPISLTTEGYRAKLDAKWTSNAPKDVAWKERAIKELWGRNLLCWCLQREDVDCVKVKQPEGCHARVLLEYVNKPE